MADHRVVFDFEIEFALEHAAQQRVVFGDDALGIGRRDRRASDGARDLERTPRPARIEHAATDDDRRPAGSRQAASVRERARPDQGRPAATRYDPWRARGRRGNRRFREDRQGHGPARGRSAVAIAAPTAPLALSAVSSSDAFETVPKRPCRSSNWFVPPGGLLAARAAVSARTGARSVATTISPPITGYAFSVAALGVPFFIAGGQKILYDP